MSISPLFQLSSDQDYHLTLKMASAQVVETSVTNNSPSQNSNHPDDLFQLRYVIPSCSSGEAQYGGTASSTVEVDDKENKLQIYCRLLKLSL